MAASYPGALKSFTQQTDLVDTVDAADVNSIYDEVEAMQTEMGLNPPDVDDTVTAVSAAADLATRLDHIAFVLKTIMGAANWYTAVAAVLENDFNAKGDILSASADNTPLLLAVSATKFSQLYVDSAEATGLKWGLRKYVQMTVFEYTTDTATGDGAAYLHIPAHLAGLNLVEIHGEVITAGTTNTLDVQIANVTQAVDMLTTKLTIDTGETGSDTAATAAVIDTANDDVAVNDLLRVDVDAVHTTAAKGLIVTLGFA